MSSRTHHYTCHHADPHTGLLSDSFKERWWRMFLRLMGWLEAGYCYLYYPAWLRDTWEKYYWPDLAQIEDYFDVE